MMACAPATLRNAPIVHQQKYRSHYRLHLGTTLQMVTTVDDPTIYLHYLHETFCAYEERIQAGPGSGNGRTDLRALEDDPP